MLRRSSRLALLALAVFVLRIGIVAACAKDDYAELMRTATWEVAVHVLASDAATDEAMTHGAGHCLHCACHHAVALPAGVAREAVSIVGIHVTVRLIPRATPPPGLALRPPIV